MMSSKLLHIPPIPRRPHFSISDHSPRPHPHPHPHISNLFLVPTTFLTHDEIQRQPPSSISPLPRKKIMCSPEAPSLSSPDDGEEDNSVGREALRQYLEEEVGVSREESLEISSNSPSYLRTLIHNVRDMDGLLLSSISPTIRPESGPPSFRGKVYEMAKQKGDGGLLPYLESLGLTLASASHLARYLSSHSLQSLIHQVKYVKKIFFSDRDDGGGLAGKLARQMMMHLCISVDEDVQQTLSFFEKVQARRGGLELLASADASFRHLIESFPALLYLPIESRVNSMVEFLEENGVPRESVQNIFLLFPPIIFVDIEKDLKPRLLALQKVGLEDRDFGMLMLKYPWVLSSSILSNLKKILDFFAEEEVPQDCVTKGVKNFPLLLGCSVKRLLMMVDQLSELEIRNKKLGRVIARSPQLLLQKTDDFLKVITFFKNLGLDEASIGRILARCPEIFSVSIEETIKRKIGFLASIGILEDHLPRVIRKYPDLFLCDVDKALRPRMMYLMKIGLSKKDVGFMVRRFSPLLGYSIEGVLRPKTEFLLRIMEKPLRDVVEYPRYFSYSLEKKIKPRYSVLKGRKLECSLKEMLSKNDEEFVANFVDGESGIHVQSVK